MKIERTKNIGLTSEDKRIIYLYKDEYSDFLSLAEKNYATIIFTLCENGAYPIRFLKNKNTTVNGCIKISEFMKENLNKLFE